MPHNKFKLSLLMFLLLGMVNTAVALSWLDIFLDTMKPRTHIPTISVDLHYLIEQNSARYGIPPAFSAVVVYLESGYDSGISYECTGLDATHTKDCGVPWGERSL